MHAQSHTPSHDLRLGIGAGILAGSFWGLVFLAPILVPGFTPLQLSSARYLAYGLVALLLIAPMWRRLLGRLTWREWRQLAWLSLCGNIIYYLFVAQAVQSGGGVMTAIVIGLLPLTVTLVGSRDHGALPLRRLAPALLARIELEPCLPWTTEAMARTANVSVSRLHALFREELGASPHGWLLDCRLKRACALLAATNRPVAEIALATGFSEQSALTRAMRRVLDTTPSAYRAQHQETRSKPQ